MNPGHTTKPEGVCRAAAIFLLTLCVTQFAFAKTSGQPDAGNIPDRLAQKQAFVHSMVENAPAAERIRASQDAEALGLVTLAKNNYAYALAALKNGNFAGAEKQLNEVMSKWILLLSLQAHSSDSVALAVKQRVESKKLLESYEKLLGSVEFLEKSYRGYVKRAGLSPVDASLNEDAELARLADGMVEARMYASTGRADGALKALSNVAQVMKSAMNRVLGSVTVDYTMKFETLAEEYAYELERNRSYLELVPVAIAEFKPTDDEKLTIGKLVEQNRLALEQAREYAGQQDYQRALATVYAGMGFLELALSSAGLVAPYVWLSPYDWQSWPESGV